MQPRYAIPVNSTKPGTDLSAYGLWNQPFGKEKNLTFSLDGDIGWSSNTGYQTSTRLPAIDKDNSMRINVMGRYFLVGLVFNFGKMNAAQSNRVEQVMWEMAY